jgi:hypothetical protein
VTCAVEPERVPPRSEALRAATLVVATLAICALLELHVQWMNGLLWTRDWCSRPVLEVFPVFLAGSLPLWWAVRRREQRGGAHDASSVVALACTCLILLLAACVLYDGTFAPERLPRAIEHEYVTSYYLDALRLREVPGFLAEYPRLMDTLHLHSENKPPGAVLFFMAFISVFGPDQAAMASGLFMALLAALIIVSVWWMVATVTESRPAAFASAALMALCPGLVLGLPSMDALFAHFTCLLAGTWTIALRRDSRGAACAFGLVLAVALLFTPLVLVVGALLAGMTVLHLAPREARAERARQVARQVAFVAAAFAGFYAVAFATTGYDVIATFREVLGSKYDWNPELTRQELLGRPYWKALISDPWEFLLGTGWLIGLLALFRLRDAVRERRGTWLVEILALATIVLMPLLSFVRGESARLWMFLVPLLVLPAGVELARWTARRRALALASLLLVLTTVFVNMRFVER